MIVFIYLLKLVACTALFYGYYYLFLRNKRMHKYNRFYILASVTVSVVLPLIKIPVFAVGNTPSITNSLLGMAFGGWENEVIITARQGFLHSLFTAQNILIIIYVSGLLLTIYPVIRSLAYIRSIAARHTGKDIDNIRLYSTVEPGTPFSFFNIIFWNDNIPLETEEGQQILRHELYHVQQKHSYDILFIQVANCLLWFNPFLYLMNRELRTIHEFLADEHTAVGTDKHQYAELLVARAITPKQIVISHQFFYNQIKRRITMILQNNNTRYSYIRRAMAIPVVLLIFCTCSVKNKDEVIISQAAQAETNKERIISFLKAQLAAAVEQKVMNAAINDEDIFTKVNIESSYPNGPGAWMNYLNKNFKYPREAQDRKSQGTVLVRFIVEKDGYVRNVETIQGTLINKVAAPGKSHYNTDESLNKEAIRIIAESGKWLPAVHNGKAVNSYKIQPITFRLEE